MVRAGELLLQAKDEVGHGYWTDWLHNHCDLSERTAQAYTRLARNKANPQLSADLTIDDALEVLAKPKPAGIAGAPSAPETGRQGVGPADNDVDPQASAEQRRAEVQIDLEDLAPKGAMNGPEPKPTTAAAEREARRDAEKTEGRPR
jgi:hypothetical protein